MILLLLACADPAPDAAAYVEAVRATRDDPRRASEMCARIPGDAGAECASWAASALARNGDPAAAEAICDGITMPVWQDECRFLVAEEMERVEGPEVAARRCRAAGRFTDKCLFHVWKGFAGQLSGRPPIEAMEAYAPALGWADGALVVDRRFELRFWDTFFDAAFADRKLDPASCDDFVSRADTCRAVLPAALERRLQRSPRHSGSLSCPMPDDASARSAAIRHASGTDYAPTPDLDEVALRYYGRRCPPPASPDPR